MVSTCDDAYQWTTRYLQLWNEKLLSSVFLLCCGPIDDYYVAYQKQGGFQKHSPLVSCELEKTVLVLFLKTRTVSFVIS